MGGLKELIMPIGRRVRVREQKLRRRRGRDEKVEIDSVHDVERSFLLQQQKKWF